MVKKLMRLRARSISGAPEPFATLHRACTLAALADRRKEQDIALALMIDLPVVNRKKTTNFNKFY
jgi:hypothetical protein